MKSSVSEVFTINYYYVKELVRNCDSLIALIAFSAISKPPRDFTPHIFRTILLFINSIIVAY